MSDAPPESILVRGPNWAGDLVMSTPGFRALRRAHPEARIVLHLQRGLESLLDGSPWFDAVVAFDSRARPRTLGLLRAARRVAREHGPFDLGICIPDSFSSAWVMRAAGARRVVGYARGGRGWLLHRAIPPDPAWGRRRLVARERFVLGLLEAAGVVAPGGSDTTLELHTTAEEEARADALLGREAGAPVVAVAPGASYGSAKCWPAESFARVGDAAAAAGARVVLLGSAGESGITRAVASAMKAGACDLAGRADLGAAKAVLRRAAVLVANDAGARHIAVAFGVPSVVLFGPTSVAKTDLNLDTVSVLETRADCRPCYRRECPIDHRCMTGIDPERVVAATLQALGRDPGRAT
ncbi:MAG: lipopolysaccharide heptosyltransferase II [Myxococcota bacterium]